MRRVRPLALACGVAALAVVGGARWAAAQTGSSQALFLEAVRDPGNPDVAATARSLALGGVRLGTGQAEDGGSSAATLMLGRGLDMVGSVGAFVYSRDELLRTPDRFPPRDPNRGPVPGSRSLPSFAGAALRGSVWAVAGFFDRSAVLSHAFDTATSNIYFAALQGTFISEDGTGHVSFSERVSRIGGAGALSLPNRRLGVGLTWTAVRLDYQAIARVHIDTEAAIAGGQVSRSSTEVENSAMFAEWAPSVTISAMGKPAPAITIAARWERAPTFAGTHAVVSQDAFQTTRFENDIRFRLPATWSLGVSAVGAGTVVVSEVARTAFSQALRPVERVAGTGPCAIPNANCPGWGLANYEAADATSWRAGVEQGISAGTGTLLLRGGILSQTGYTVARRTDDPLRNGGSLPAPPFLADWEPPRSSSLWFGGGIGYRHGGCEVAFGAARSDKQLRWLVDVRVAR